MNLVSSPQARRCFAFAAIAYLAVSAWLLGSVALRPHRLLPYNSGINAAAAQIGHFDQSMVVSVITRNADTLLTEPWNLFGDGQCYPFPRSFTLGEHMFGEGLLMLVPWAITGDPILSYNALLVLTLWLPGLTMYAFSYHFTRSAPAAFVAGLLFVLAPPRIIDGGHPYLHADYWLPLALLFLHRLFVRGGFGNALAVGLFLGLEALETIYVLLACAMVVGVYGSYLVLRHPARLRQVIVPLAVAAVLSVACAWVVLSPYLETRDAWALLAGRATTLFPPDSYNPGKVYFPGVLALGLAVVAMVDRLRRPRLVDGEDPRWAMLLAGIVIVAASLLYFPIPFSSIIVPGPFLVLSKLVPGLDALRGLFAVAIGLWVPLAFLAGYGALVLVERLPHRVAIGVAALLSFAAIGERFLDGPTRWSFGSRLDLASWEARPRADDIALVRRVSEGPVVHVPMAAPEHDFTRLAMSQHLLLQSFAPQPVSSCYNSFDTPLDSQMYQLADALPDAKAGEALAAIGFDSVLSHTEAWWPPHRQRFHARFHLDPRNRRVVERIDESLGLEAFRLHGQAPVREDFGVLSSPADESPAEAAAGADAVEIVFANPGPDTYLHPKPWTPSDVVVQWYRDGEPLGPPQEMRAMLPIALGPGGTMRIEVPTRVPEALGSHRVTIARREEPDRVLASRDVQVRAPDPKAEQKGKPGGKLKRAS
ncbi:MAG: hypothetical protein FJ144_05115 [Deltaproteobacteria bacterium]|nr:hypothetical protein [Deltaproteobacteria bacterium]